ncbi:MAG: hypothetical protein EP332_07125 [Bacteroidetes bacterium]|nr:MAG: hypothetical protein EP332_07125 [Bacteroidota bacterium]
MNIEIRQTKLAVAAQYTILIEDTESYFASKKLFRLLTEIDFVNTNRYPNLLSIQKRWAWFKSSYDILWMNGEKAEFRTKSIWDGSYTCVFKQDLYDIIRHSNGRLYSVFKNNQQIAWWDKNKFVWLDGDVYKVTCNSDVNVELLASLCLIVDDITTANRKDGLFSAQFNNHAFEDREFNERWRPEN